MKLRGYKFLFVFVLSTSIPFFCNCQTEQTRCEPVQTVEQIIELIEVIGMDPGELNIAGLAGRIHEDMKNLCIHFENGEFDKMMAITKEETSLKTEIGIIRKKDERQNYWKKKKDEGYQSVRWEVMKGYVHSYKHPDYNAKAYIVLSFSLIKMDKGKIVKNQTNGGDWEYMHTHGCEWIRP
jgi:hypothetical protein